jgi:dUTP pyrophosphatase
MRLRVQRLVEHARLPRYMTAGAAGLDLSAALERPLSLEPGQRALVPTGIAVALPPAHEGQVRPRSGLAARHGVTVLNAPGTIDADYRGELKVLLINLGEQTMVIEPGMRVAQLIVAPVSRALPEEVNDLDATTRGVGGFGHTG